MRAEFSENLITGNELIDSQHKELIGRINKLLDSCEGEVYLMTRDGDRLNLKSKLCQLVGLTTLIEGGKIAEAFVMCEKESDESKLFRFNLYKARNAEDD